MEKTPGLEPISQHIPHTSTHAFKMEFLTPHHPPRGVPAPTMPVAPMPPYQHPPGSRKPCL